MRRVFAGRGYLLPSGSLLLNQLCWLVVILFAPVASARNRPDSSGHSIPQRLLIPYISQPLFINGILTEWDSAAVLAFAPADTRAESSATTVKAMWDEQRLYFAFIVNSGSLQARQVEGKNDVWQDSSVEIFLDTKNDARSFNPYQLTKQEFVRRGGHFGSIHSPVREYLGKDDYHFIINMLNTLESIRGEDLNPGYHLYNVDVLSVVAQRYDARQKYQGYTVEVAIPWRTIGLEPEAGMRLGADFGINHFDGTKRQWFDWCKLTQFNQPHRWGQLILAGRNRSSNFIATSSLVSGILMAIVTVSLLMLLWFLREKADLSPVTPEAGAPSRHSRTVSLLEAFIAQHYASPGLSTAQAAAHLNMSVRNLQLILSKEHNLTFTNSLNDYRIAKAQELIVTTDLTINQICYQVGFSTPSYFIKLFRSRYGVTPAEYRKGVLSA